MKFEEIAPFVFLIVFWLFSFIARKLKKSQKAGPKKGFTLKILEFIAQLKEASEKEMSAQASFDPQPVPLTAKEEEVVAKVAVNQSDEERHVTFTALPVAEHYKKTAVQAQPAGKSLRGNRFGQKITKQKMRNAIIWSEVLATPVGLRENL